MLDGCAPLSETERFAQVHYSFVRAFVSIAEAVDGWQLFFVTDETETRLDAFGLMWLAPGGTLPLGVELIRDGERIAWTAHTGAFDERWAQLSESGRWKAVYLHATEGSTPPWNWRPPVCGVAVLGAWPAEPRAGETSNAQQSSA